MPRILYGVSPIGLGHATRSLVVADSLKRNGAEVRLFSGGKAAEFISGQGLAVDALVDDAAPWTRGVEMGRVSLWYLRAWLAQRANVKRVARLAEAYRPDIVVCDEEFSGLEVAKRLGLKRVLIADELDLGFARSWVAKKIEARVERWYRGLQEGVDLLIVPEPGNDGGNRRYVGPIVRGRTADCEATRGRHGIPPGRVVLFSMSGSGIGRVLVERLVRAMEAGRLPDCNLVVTGNRGPRFVAERVLDLGVVPDNQDLVACADVIVSTAGKSTIDEAAAAGTPMVAIPIRFHAEQERNAAALGYTSDDAGRVAELVAMKIGRRETPRTFHGEENASRLILSLI